jgi:hypothetical protein
MSYCCDTAPVTTNPDYCGRLECKLNQAEQGEWQKCMGSLLLSIGGCQYHPVEHTAEGAGANNNNNNTAAAAGPNANNPAAAPNDSTSAASPTNTAAVTGKNSTSATSARASSTAKSSATKSKVSMAGVIFTLFALSGLAMGLCETKNITDIYSVTGGQIAITDIVSCPAGGKECPLPYGAPTKENSNTGNYTLSPGTAAVSISNDLNCLPKLILMSSMSSLHPSSTAKRKKQCAMVKKRSRSFVDQRL